MMCVRGRLARDTTALPHTPAAHERACMARSAIHASEYIVVCAERLAGKARVGGTQCVTVTPAYAVRGGRPHTREKHLILGK